MNKKNQPVMVNVGAKPITHRIARAQAVVLLPQAVWRCIRGGELSTPKGPVFQTARLAGIMAAKQTSALIPLCHPLALEDCRIEIRTGKQRTLIIECAAETHHKTGVEMEALTGAALAALTIYDMCKGLSHDITIQSVRLLEKTGGKHTYIRKS
ncbi:MAG: cyclic pyranopterin monophosphate synthase MoaC [Lentisphaerota bacterium]